MRENTASRHTPVVSAAVHGAVQQALAAVARGQSTAQSEACSDAGSVVTLQE